MPDPRRALADAGWPLRSAFYAALGVVAGLGQAPWGLWPLTLIALAAAMWCLETERGWRRVGLAGWAMGAGYFALTLHWIVQPFFVDAPRHGWMAPFALVFMALGMALFWAAAGAVAAILGQSRDGGRAGPWGIVAAFGAAEVVRSLVLTGFPWALLGHVWIGTPLSQLAAVTGPHGLSLLTLALPAAVLTLWRRKRWLPVPAAVLALGWVALDPGPLPQPDASAPLVRLVQPNARQDSKWDPGMAETLFRRQLQLTATGAGGADPARIPDLVVWPETAVQWLLEHSEDVLRDVALAGRGAPVVLGIVRREESRYFNSMVVVDRTGAVTGLYDKWHLVPFGEYVPFGEVMARFGIHGLAASQGGGYTPGEGPALIEVPGLGSAMPLICYEGIFAEEVNAAPDRPRLLILITNDAWFGDRAGPAQHFAQARLRAIEQGVPLVRVANTGISGLIDPQGRVLGHLPLNEAGALDLPLPDAAPPTIYSFSGDWPAIVLLFLMFAGLSRGRRRFAVDPFGAGA